jgi:protoporphyrinogen IX oxidase
MDAELYHWLKALHIISFVAWMAAMFYLPRLFVYHATAPVGGELSQTLKIMERKLLRYICNPAMIATFIFGLWLAVITGYHQEGWFHVKFALVLLLAAFHGACARWRKQFERDANIHSEKFYRIANEVPTLLLVVIVLLAVFKPF